jgi:hypothetical protein
MPVIIIMLHHRRRTTWYNTQPVFCIRIRAVCTFEIFLPTYQNTRHHIPEENNYFFLRISQREPRDVTLYTFLHTIATEGTAASSFRVNNGISRFYRVSTYLPKYKAPHSPGSNLKRVCSQQHPIT